MNKEQYNNIIEKTIAKEQNNLNNIELARKILKNMGVPLPSGDLNNIVSIIKKENYMGWRKCSFEDAKSSGEKGIATIGISDDEKIIKVFSENELSTEKTNLEAKSDNYLDFSNYNFYAYNSMNTVDPKILHFANSEYEVKIGWNGYNYVYGSATSTLHWSSSNSNVATVNYSTGQINAIGVGTAYITATTEDGYSGTFSITVNGIARKLTTEKTLTGSLLADGIVVPQSYRVSLELKYKMTKASNGKVFISEVSAFTMYVKGNITAGVSYPDLSIGKLTIGNTDYLMETFHTDRILPANTVFDEKRKIVNKWVDEGTAISVLSTLMLDASLFPYRQVKIDSNINL